MNESLSRFPRPVKKEKGEIIFSREELESMREDAFRSIILSTLSETFMNRLEETGFSDEETKSIMSATTELSFDDAAAVFGVPASIFERRFGRLLESVRAGMMRPGEIPTLLLRDAREKGFGIGYHNSSHEVLPNQRTGEWHIRPSEQDHRDGDLPRAYFSTSYKTLYRSKHSIKYLYIVRTMKDHSRTDGNWSRTNALSIIDEVPLDRIDKWVAEAVLNKKKALENESSAPLMESAA